MVRVRDAFRVAIRSLTKLGTGLFPRLVAGLEMRSGLALQLPFMQVSESMGNHDSKIVDAASVD